MLVDIQPYLKGEFMGVAVVVVGALATIGALTGVIYLITGNIDAKKSDKYNGYQPRN